MLGVGHGCFIQFPDGSRERVLHQAKIVAIEDHNYTIECAEADLSAEPGQHILLFYELRRTFVQLPILIVDVAHTDPCLVLTFKLAGEPVSAQSREFYRVSTVLSDMYVDIGPEANCQLLDVSVNGLSLSATGNYKIGRILIMRIDFGGKDYTGTARVQSAKKLDNKRTRYGLLCFADAISGENLQAGLRQITMTLQRKQLKRLSRAT